MRGEWIEIILGLWAAALSPASLPMRGEWIEIKYRRFYSVHNLSLPMRGEWIEILHPAERAKKEVTSLPARGE